MSVDTAPKLRRKSNLAFGVETTTGTPLALTATNGVVNFFNADIKFNDEEVSRDQQGALSPIQQSIGARSGTCTFETELVGAGTSGGTFALSALFQACACADSGGVISPLTSAMTTLTFAQWIDGRKKTLSGSQGTFRITMRRGQPARVAWTFTGVRQPTIDAANITPTYLTSPIPPRAGSNFSFATIAARVADAVFDAGNQVVLREDAGATDSAGTPTGYRNAMVVNRRPTFTFAPEAFPLATLDIFALHDSLALSALSLTIGTAANNIFTIAAPKLQIVQVPQDGDRSGLYVDQITALATRNTSAGDDEWSITRS